MAALAILIVAVLILSNILPASALVIAPAATAAETEEEPASRPETERQLTETEAFVYGLMSEWQDVLVVSEYFFDQTLVLQLHYMVPALDSPDIDMQDFSDAFFNMLRSDEMKHDRVYLDIVNEAGVRLESYDVEVASENIVKAVFGGGGTTTEEPKTDDNATIELGKPFTLGANAFTIKSYVIAEDDTGKYLQISFDFTNQSDDTTSAYMEADYFGVQKGVSLTRVMTLDDYGTTYRDTPPGSTVEDCIVAFYINNETDPVSVTFEEFLGEDRATFTFDIGAKG